MAGRATDIADLSTVRTSPVRGDRPADGSGPRPDGGRQAVDTSSAQRPTMRLAIRPRPTTRPVRPGPDQTGRQCACLPWANPSRYQHRDPGHDHLQPCSLPERPQAWSRPKSARSCPASTMDATIGQVPDTACPVVSGRTPSTPSARHGEPEAMRTGNGRTARKAFGRPRSPCHKGGPSGSRALLWGRSSRVGNQGRLVDGKTASTTVITAATGSCLISLHRSSRASAHCCPRTITGSSVERTAKLHPLWRCTNGGWLRAVSAYLADIGGVEREATVAVEDVEVGWRLMPGAGML